MGQACVKLFGPGCIPRFPRIPGIHRLKHRRVDKHLIWECSDDSGGSNGESSLQCKYVDYPFLLNREIGEWIVFTKFIIIIRGPPGSGKSRLASYIKIHFPTAHVSPLNFLLVISRYAVLMIIFRMQTTSKAANLAANVRRRPTALVKQRQNCMPDRV